MRRFKLWLRVSAGSALIAGLAIGPLATGSATSAGATGTSPSWTQLSLSNAPSARFLGAMAYDAATGTMMLFGGYDAGELVNDTWAWNGTTWTRLFPATSPPVLYYRSMTYDAANGTLVLFGGRDYSAAFHNETWTWNGSTWTQMSPATSPPARAGAAMTYDPATGNVVLFGGYSDSGSGYLNDTWTWNGSTWTQQTPTSSPPVEYGSAMAFDSSTGNVVLFGGEGDGVANNDTWTWNGASWTELFPATSPPALYAAGFADYPGTGSMVLFGGSSNTVGATGDTWTWNGSTWSQQLLTPSPTVRWLPSMAYDPATGNELLFGGITTGFAYLGDTWNYDAPLSVSTLLSNLAGQVVGVGPGNSLASKLAQAGLYFSSNDAPNTCSTLNDFMAEVSAQSGKKITTALAATLVGEANAIATELSC